MCPCQYSRGEGPCKTASGIAGCVPGLQASVGLRRAVRTPPAGQRNHGEEKSEAPTTSVAKMAAGLPISLSRSRSLPTVDKGVCGEWEDEVEGEGTGGRDSGVVVVASDHASFASDARSSLLGDLPSGLAVSELPSEEIAEEGRGGAGQTEDPSKRETIGRHYYPEGGWGWVVVVMALMVQVVAHGLHQAGGVMLLHTLAKFPESSLLAASKLTCLFVYSLVVGVIRVTCPHF